MTTEYDLGNMICPLSKVKATQVIENLGQGEAVRIILGDTDSLKSVVRELKTIGIPPSFKQEAEKIFILTITK